MEILKKQHRGAITNRYSFPTTDEMKSNLDELKELKGYDVNEMFRRFAAKIISTSKSDADDLHSDAEAV